MMVTATAKMDLMNLALVLVLMGRLYALTLVTELRAFPARELMMACVIAAMEVMKVV
jgi:hypothetical protein